MQVNCSYSSTYTQRCILQTVILKKKQPKLQNVCHMCLKEPLPPDTTTFALVSSGRSLFVRFCSNHSESPAGGVAATAVRSQMIRTKGWQYICKHTWACTILVPYEYIIVNLPSADAALPPVAAASNDVPLTVKILTGSLHLTVLRAFPSEWKY